MEPPYKMNAWKKNLRSLRIREIKILSAFLKDRQFISCLELGAGEGWQSAQLKRFCSSVLATDLNEDRLFSGCKINGVTRSIVDAENLEDAFPNQKFDLIFSSNMLEHLPEPNLCLQQSKNILDDGGMIVHIVPNLTWRFLCALLYYPVKLRNVIRMFTKTSGWNSSGLPVSDRSPGSRNNLKKDPVGQSLEKNGFLSRILQRMLPPVHGVSDGVFQEALMFRKNAWAKLFIENGLVVDKVIKGPLSSGHGLGFEKVKNFLEQRGLCGSYIFILSINDDE